MMFVMSLNKKGNLTGSIVWKTAENGDIYASPSSLKAGLEAWGLDLLLRPYVRYSDGLIYAPIR